ncbi:MAG: signal peptidase II [Elusimicrobiota bacterium]|nr:signal peptidase II [Elusimicrobiota bacterium]
MPALKVLWARQRAELAFIPLLFALDRLSKIAALDLLQPLGSVKLAPFLRFTYVENTGAAFGSFQGGNYALAVAAVIVLGLLFYWRGDLLKYGPAARGAFILITAGALGNLYDRIILGYVVDYIDFIIWPVFNAADSFITIGACLLCWCFLKESLRNRREGKK